MSDGSAVLVKWMSLSDANSAGHIHGGTVMKLCDETAGLAAIRHARGRVVTAAVDRLTFLHPVHVGDVLTLSASANAAWRTSMEVGVRLEAENPFTGEVRHTSSAYLTMVAVDDQGRPCRAAARRVACTRTPRTRGGAAAAKPPRRTQLRTPPDAVSNSIRLPAVVIDVCLENRRFWRQLASDTNPPTIVP
jgi:acyl-CoA hydrolase